MFGIRYASFDAMTHVLHYQNGKISKEGRGLSFFYFEPVSSIVAIPIGSNDLPFIFSETTGDYQTVNIQGQITYKVGDPKTLADTSSPNVKTPTDAGVWITPLTGIKTEKLDLEYTFSTPEDFENLCRADVAYIFASAVNTSFSIAEIEKRKEFYIPTIILPDTRLYQVNCSPS